eukprot:8006075-Pyramimonas_sp.AAC.5
MSSPSPSAAPLPAIPNHDYFTPSHHEFILSRHEFALGSYLLRLQLFRELADARLQRLLHRALLLLLLVKYAALRLACARASATRSCQARNMSCICDCPAREVCSRSHGQALFVTSCARTGA